MKTDCFVIAAYAITTVLIGGLILSTWWRARRIANHLERAGNE